MKVGRVRAMSISIFVYSVFTGLCYFAQSPAQIGGLRFFSAVGMGGEWSLGVALVMEVWPARFRPTGNISSPSVTPTALTAVGPNRWAKAM